MYTRVRYAHTLTYIHSLSHTNKQLWHLHTHIQLHHPLCTRGGGCDWHPGKVPFHLFFLPTANPSVHGVCVCMYKCGHEVCVLFYMCVNLWVHSLKQKKMRMEYFITFKFVVSGHFQVYMAATVPTYKWRAWNQKNDSKSLIVGHFSDSYSTMKHLTSSVLGFCISVWWMASIWNGF